MTRYSPDSDELTGGKWVTLPGGLYVWEPDDPDEWAEQRKKAPETVDPRTWSDERLRRHHADYIRGERDLRTEAGHREWMRRYKARKRAEQREQRHSGAA